MPQPLTYIELPVETDPDVLARDVLTALNLLFPGWTPAAGDLETILTQRFAIIAALARDTASRVPTTIVRFLGTLIGVLPLNPTFATATSTWTMINSSGYTIPAGTQVAIRTAGDTLVPFQVRAEVTVPAGSTTTAAGEVVLDAINAGADSSGLGAPGGPVELIDTLVYVASVALTAATANGSDGETDDEYLGRFSARMTLLAPTPILPRDFELLARDLAWVARAVAVDGYNPDDATTGNERMVAVYAIDEAGNAGSTANKNALRDYLDSLREATFIVKVADPTYTNVDVTFAGVALPGYAVADVEAAAEAAVALYLSPANRGIPPGGGAHDWVNDTVVRYRELVALLENVPGMDHLTSGPAIGLAGGAQTEADHALTGVVTLTRPGTISGTVT